ncbi:MAG: histidine kinase [Bacteroidota bacterium]
MRIIKDLPVRYIYCIAIGLALGIILGAKTYLPYIYWGETDEYVWRRSFMPHFINNGLWGFLVPLVYYGYSRWPLSWPLQRHSLFRAFGYSMLIAAFHEIFSNVIWFGPMHYLGIYPFSERNLQFIIGAFPSALINRIVEFWIIFALFSAIDYAKKYRNKELELAQTQHQLSQAQLNALRLQLHPHFLFNTLNTISSLMEVNVKGSQKIVSKLGTLLRTVLEKDQRTTISLGEELDYIKSYLDIEQVRFHDRLQVHYDIDPSTLKTRVPSFFLQPLVENAIRHGLAPSTDNGWLRIESHREKDDRIVLRVEDNGKGSPHGQEALLAKGIGLRNVKERLDLLYKDGYTLKIDTQNGEGFQFFVEIPEIEQPSSLN